MRRLYLVLGPLVLIGVLVLVACSPSATPTPTPLPTATATPTPAPTPTPTATPTFSGPPSSAPVPAGFANPSLLVDTAWLAQHLNDSKLVVIDVRAADKYQAEHIPGAVNLLQAQFAPTVNDIANQAPTADDFARLVGQAGVSNDTRVVIVDDGNMLTAARLFWTFEYFGFDKASVLHGGFAAWKADGRETTRKAPSPVQATFTARVTPATLASLDQVSTWLGDSGVAIVDNRSPKEYTGEDLRAKRGGHIPGAVNIDWNLHLNSGDVPTLKSPTVLRKLYEDQGITPDKEIVTYCQTGVRAAHGYLVLRLLGYPKVKNYDGSWAEWGNREDTLVQK